MAGPPGGTGAATVPGPMPGAAAAGMTGVKLGLEALQKALPTLPMGSDLHSSVLKAVSDISKHVGDAGAGQSGQDDALKQMLAGLAAQQAKGTNPLAGMMPPGGGGAPPPPPPGAA